MNDSEQNRQHNSISIDRMDSNIIANEIAPININNNQNICNGNSQEENNANNTNIIPSIFITIISGWVKIKQILLLSCKNL